MRRINKKRIGIIAAIIAVIAAGTASAYFTDVDAASNDFTIGNISISLSEPEWDEENGKNIIPNKTVSKDPQVTNDGVNDAFVFMKVEVPAAYIQSANLDGSLNDRGWTDLFSYDVNEGWTEVAKNKTDVSNIYTYAYTGDDGAMKVLAPGETTPAIFDAVTFVNAVEGQISDVNMSIKINTMGIQTAGLTTDSPKELLSIIENQSN